MSLLSPDQSKLLTFPGFVERVEDYWLKQGLTQQKAFEEANKDVTLITGEPRYEPEKFDSFITSYKQNHRGRGRKREGAV